MLNKISGLFLLLPLSVFPIKRNIGIPAPYSSKSPADTISGYYLFEVNAPEKCFTRFDQVEQGPDIINYDAMIGEKEIGEIYEQGVFCFSPQPMINSFFLKGNSGLKQNRNSIDSFSQVLNPFTHRDDASYNKNVLRDKHGILTYKKVYAKFVVVKLGKTAQLVPDTKNFVCCYSNYKKAILTWFITDVLEFRVL